MRNLNKLCLIFVLGSTCIANAASLDPFEKLTAEVASHAVFRQFTADRHCPQFITPSESDILSEKAKAGDRQIYLESAKSSDDFTYGGNWIYYRPSLKQGKANVLDRSLTFPAGIAYSVSKQTVKDGVLVSEYSTKVGSVAMIASANFKVQYDANSDTIRYHFSGNGVDDVDCVFNKVN